MINNFVCFHKCHVFAVLSLSLSSSKKRMTLVVIVIEHYICVRVSKELYK